MIHLLRQRNIHKKPYVEYNRGIISYLPDCKDYCLAATGRSLLNFLIRKMRLTCQDTCLMPAYIAEGVLQPFRKNGINVQFYKLDNRLFIDQSDLEEKIYTIPSIKICILVHPFGFEQPVVEVKKLLHSKGIYLFEDCAQSLFSCDIDGKKLGSMGDLSLFSLNKFLPVPEGAVLQNHGVTNLEISSAQMGPTSKGKEQSFDFYLKHLNENSNIYLSNNTDELKSMVERSEAFYENYYSFIKKDLDLYKSSSEDLNRVEYIDLETMVKTRRRNTRLVYNHVDNELFRFVYDFWQENCVPMAIPMYVPVELRDKIVLNLFNQNILVSILKDKWDFLPENKIAPFVSEKNFIDSHILLPVSEFIDSVQIEQMIDAINKYDGS